MEQQKLSLIAGRNVNGVVILEDSLADTKLNSLTIQSAIMLTRY